MYCLFLPPAAHCRAHKLVLNISHTVYDKDTSDRSFLYSLLVFLKLTWHRMSLVTGEADAHDTVEIIKLSGWQPGMTVS